MTSAQTDHAESAPGTSPEAAAEVSGEGSPVISVRGVSKRFKIYPRPWGRLAEWLTWGKAVRHEDFWALRGVDLTVGRGECVGIIGPNGSGKSTLLKIITGVLTPTTGSVSIRGRVLSLLELGTGLNPDLTGRQNIIHSAQLLGFPRDYASEKMEQIEEFAELGEFFDRPIRLYSSGMQVRLSFSMYACFEPEVLIVDEALSVGDIYFQQKCVRHMREMLDTGTTLLLVSHDLITVRRVCRRAGVLFNGEMVFLGESERAVNVLEELQQQQFREMLRVSAGKKAAVTEEVASSRAVRVELPAGAQERNWQSNDEMGSRELELVYYQLQDAGEQPAEIYATGQPIRAQVYARVNRPVGELECGFAVRDRLNHTITTGDASMVGIEKVGAGEMFKFVIEIPGRLNAGEYLLDVGLGFGDRGDGAPRGHYHRVGGMAVLRIFAPPGRRPLHGSCDIGAKIVWPAGGGYSGNAGASQ